MLELLTVQVGSTIGGGTADAIRSMIENASLSGTGVGAKVAGVAALLFGATGAFGQLQKALNRAWEVETVKEEGGFVSLVLKRVLSFGMVLTIAFMLLVSFVISMALAALGDATSAVAGDGIGGALVQVLNVVVGLRRHGGPVRRPVQGAPGRRDLRGATSPSGRS